MSAISMSSRSSVFAHDGINSTRRADPGGSSDPDGLVFVQLTWVVQKNPRPNELVASRDGEGAWEEPCGQSKQMVVLVCGSVDLKHPRPNQDATDDHMFRQPLRRYIFLHAVCFNLWGLPNLFVY